MPAVGRGSLDKGLLGWSGTAAACQTGRIDRASQPVFLRAKDVSVHKSNNGSGAAVVVAF